MELTLKVDPEDHGFTVIAVSGEIDGFDAWNTFVDGEDGTDIDD